MQRHAMCLDRWREIALSLTSGLGVIIPVLNVNMSPMDISELRGPVGLVLVLAAFVATTALGKRVGRRWLRWPIRTAAISGAILTTLALVLVIFGEFHVPLVPR